MKLALLVGQVQKQDFTHLPITQSLSAEKPVAPFPAGKTVEALEMLKAEFDVRFRELHVHAKEIRLFQNPFAADIDEALPCYQLELQNCDVLKDAFKPIEFYAALLLTSKGMQWRCPHFLAARISVNKPFHSWNWWKLWDQDSLMNICISLWDWLWQE